MMAQEELFSIPAARSSDPHTSHEAAASVRNLRESQRQILDVLLEHGALTDEEIAARLLRRGVWISPSGARTRRSELVRKGLVVDTGERLRTRANRRTIVWGLARGASW